MQTNIQVKENIFVTLPTRENKASAGENTVESIHERESTDEGRSQSHTSILRTPSLSPSLVLRPFPLTLTGYKPAIFPHHKIY